MLEKRRTTTNNVTIGDEFMIWSFFEYKISKFQNKINKYYSKIHSIFCFRPLSIKFLPILNFSAPFIHEGNLYFENYHVFYVDVPVRPCRWILHLACCLSTKVEEDKAERGKTDK